MPLLVSKRIAQRDIQTAGYSNTNKRDGPVYGLHYATTQHCVKGHNDVRTNVDQ